jgi:hypothetical protein
MSKLAKNTIHILPTQPWRAEALIFLSPGDLGAARNRYREAENGNFRGAHNHACVLAAEGCVAGALHWCARSLGDAPEPMRQHMLEGQHLRCARRELESAPVVRAG